MSPQIAADIVALVDEFSPAVPAGVPKPGGRRPRRPPAPKFHGVSLEVGDVATVRHSFHAPISLTVRNWGQTRDGKVWVAGNRRSALVSEILVVERDGVRL